jgi:signal transduction histidine kinase
MASRAQEVLETTLVIILLEDHGALQVVAQSGSGKAAAKTVLVQGSALGAMYRGRERVALENPLGDQATFLRELGVEAESVLVEPLEIEGPGGGMIVALRSRKGIRKGDQSALAAVAASLTQHLLAERTAEVERLRYGAQARERERERWARELHDETIQGLGALRLELANARDAGDEQRLLEATEHVVSGLEQEVMGIRHLITELRPAALDDLGLEAALQALARRANAVYGLDVDVRVDELTGQDSGARLDPELETTIYRVMQEGLNNVARHAEANHAVLNVTRENETLLATVSDDGKGIADAASAENGHAGRQNGHTSSPDIPVGGFGLPGMRERAELVGGELDLQSAPGGTTLSLRVPLVGRAEDAPSPEGSR